jgi:hypothetical protein
MAGLAKLPRWFRRQDSLSFPRPSRQPVASRSDRKHLSRTRSVFASLRVFRGQSLSDPRRARSPLTPRTAPRELFLHLRSPFAGPPPHLFLPVRPPRKKIIVVPMAGSRHSLVVMATGEPTIRPIAPPLCAAARPGPTRAPQMPITLESGGVGLCIPSLHTCTCVCACIWRVCVSNIYIYLHVRQLDSVAGGVTSQWLAMAAPLAIAVRMMLEDIGT